VTRRQAAVVVLRLDPRASAFQPEQSTTPKTESEPVGFLRLRSRPRSSALVAHEVDRSIRRTGGVAAFAVERRHVEEQASASPTFFMCSRSRVIASRLISPQIQSQ